MLWESMQQSFAKAVVWLTVAILSLPAASLSACGCNGRIASGRDCCCRPVLHQFASRLEGSFDAPQRSCRTRCRHATRTKLGNASSTQRSCECSFAGSCSCKPNQHSVPPWERSARTASSPFKRDAGEPGGQWDAILLPTSRSLVVGDPQRIPCGTSLDRCAFLSRVLL